MNESKRAKSRGTWFARSVIRAAICCSATLGCTGRRDQPATEAATRAKHDSASEVPSDFAVRQVADTAVIRTAGVPTAADDTLGTKYGKHWGPARELPLPKCQPNGPAFCLSDTARRVSSVDCCMSDERQADWIVFAAAQDSMQLFVAASEFARLVMTPGSAAGFFAEHAVNDASWIRARFGHAGIYAFTASITSDSIIDYGLRVIPVLATGASRPTGSVATLTVPPEARTNRVAVVPASMARSLDKTAFEQFAVRPGVYRVLLVRDTSYFSCRLPCSDRQSFALHAGSAVTVAP